MNWVRKYFNWESKDIGESEFASESADCFLDSEPITESFWNFCGTYVSTKTFEISNEISNMFHEWSIAMTYRRSYRGPFGTENFESDERSHDYGPFNWPLVEMVWTVQSSLILLVNKIRKSITSWEWIILYDLGVPDIALISRKLRSKTIMAEKLTDPNLKYVHNSMAKLRSF